MAADIATLGLALDSRPIVAGTRALEDLAAAAKPAQANATALEKAVRGVGDGTTALDKATRTASTGLVSLDKAAKNSSTSLSTIAKSGQFARYEMIGFGRQFADVAVSVQGGMNLMTVAFQQLPQIADIIASSKTGTITGGLKQLGNAVTSVITPARALGGGLAIVAAAGLYTYNALSQSARAADDLAKSAGTTISAVRGFQTLASFKGIDTEESAKAMASFARNVYDAKGGMGGLLDVFRANNMQARDYNGYLDGASTLIRRAAGNTQLQFSILTQMGLPATQKWVDLLEQGGDALRKAINANGTNDSAEAKLAESARKFDDAWNKATTNTGNYIKSWALGAYSAIDSLITKASGAAGSFTRALGGVPEPEREPARIVITQKGRGEAPPVDPAVAARALSLESQRLGILGQVATVNETVRQSEIAIAQARASGANISGPDAKRVLDYAKATALGVTQIRASADAYNVETSTLGMATGAATAYGAVQSKINSEKLKGNTLSGPELATLRENASVLGEAAQRAENMRAGYDALTNAGQTFSSSIRNGASAMDALKSAGASALDAISSKLMKMATDNLWTSAFGGSSGGMGGIFNGIGKMFGSGGELPGFGTSSFIGPTLNHTGYGPGDKPGPTRMVDAGIFDHAPRFHSGIGPGERAAIIRTDESVLTPGQMKAVGGAGGTVHVSMPISIDATGADSEGLARVQQQLASLKAELPQRVVAAVTTARKQRQL